MKKVKQINGYSIYQSTERDEKRDGIPAGEFYIYFSSDVRDYGREMSMPEFEGIGTIEEALELCADSTALIKEMCEDECTAVTFEDIEEKRREIEGETVKRPKRVTYHIMTASGYPLEVSEEQFEDVIDAERRKTRSTQYLIPEKVARDWGYYYNYSMRWKDDEKLVYMIGFVMHTYLD